MKQLWLALFCLLISVPAFAVSSDMSPEQAQEAINKRFLTTETVEITKGLKKQTDYVAENYQEGELRRLILNMEKLARKTARKNNNEYIPYDRRIDVKNPQQVKRFFRNRINAIY